MENKKFENGENLMKLIRGELELDSGVSPGRTDDLRRRVAAQLLLRLR